MSDWSFAERGFSLFPLLPRTKIPQGRWKEFMSRRATPAELAEWQRWASNTGVATGAISNIIVLDCDDLLARIEVERRGIPPTLTVSTPRGTHFYFEHPGWAISNKVGLMWDGWDRLGVDLRGDGGFVVGPGSHFVPNSADVGKGKMEGRYAVERDLPLAQMPDWLIELTWPKPGTVVVPPRMAEETSAFGRVALNAQLNDLTNAGDGAVSHQIYATAARIAELVAGGEITTEEGWGGLHEVLAARGLEDEDKANGTVQRAWAKGTSNPKSGEHRPAITPEQALGVRQAASGDPVAPPPPSAMPSFIRPLVPKEMVLGSDVVDYFAGCVYLVNRDKMFLPTGVMVSKSAFDGLYGGPAFDLVNGKAPVRSAWEMFRTNAHVNMPMAWDVCFRPELPPGQTVMIDGLPFHNIYVPINTPRKAGDASPFLNHLRKLLPDGRDADYLLHWMASCVQNPGHKFSWWPVIQGTKGNGKSLLLRVMTHAIGERYTHLVRADAVIKTGNQFNEWVEGKLFLGFEEIRSSDGRRDFVEMMKDTVTDSRISSEGKGKGQGTVDNRANGMMLSNWKDSCPIDDDERRWAVFFTAQQCAEDLDRDGMGGASYFPKLYDWLRADGYAIVTHYLATMPLQAEMDPAQSLHRAPWTTSTQEAVVESRGVIEQEIAEAIDGGLHGFQGGVVTSLALRGLLDRMRKTIGPKRYRSIMASVGFVTHPALDASRGRPNNPIFDGTRPVFYFKRDHEILKNQEISSIISQTENILRGEASAENNVIPFRR